MGPASDEPTTSPLSPTVSRLEHLVKEVFGNASAAHAAPTLEILEQQCQRLQELRLILIDSQHRVYRVKDEFRRTGGLEACNGLVQSLLSFTTVSDKPDLSIFRALFEAIRSVFAVLSETLVDHVGNRDYFGQRGKNHWSSLEESLAGICESASPDPAIRVAVQSRIFSLLFALALREEDASAILKHWRLDTIYSVINGSPAAATADLPSYQDDSVLEAQIASTAKTIGPLWIPEAVSVVVGLWTRFARTQLSDASVEWPSLSIAVLVTVNATCRYSEYNAVSVHRAGAISSVLEMSIDCPPSHLEATCLSALCSSLLRFGLKSRSDAKLLFQKARSSKRASELLLHAIKESRQPSHFIFDMSLHGFASVEFAALKDDFPPREPATGYSFTAWLRIVKFDSRCHTTLVGAFDETQSCFFLLYVERDSRQLVLQTSVTAERPSVRFRCVTFKPRRWYHIALVHHRPRADSMSKAALFVNGQFCEQAKCHFPQQPPLLPRANPASRSKQQHARVQAFFGTPRDLSPRLGSGMLDPQWDLACANLINEALPDELVFVYKNLGPAYQGNYRDSLGSFQTYRASALLNIQNESLNPGNEETSLIAGAVKGAAASLVPESNIVLSLSAQKALDSDAIHYPLGSGLDSMPPRALEQLQKRLRAGGVGKVAVNQAIPNLADALSAVSGVAVLTGGMNVSNSGGLDAWSWQLSGCVPLALASLISATSQQDTIRSLSIAFELIKDSWRNSEAFERENGFALLAWLLRTKIMAYGRPTGPADEDPFSLKLLMATLEFVGFDHSNATDSIINNPLAYRSLLLDTDMWRVAESQTQRLYYDQFVVFASASSNHAFNLKRLVRMRAAKKILDSLKSAAVHKEALPSLLNALKTLFVCMPSTDLYRSLALYITFATSSATLTSSSAQRDKVNAPLRRAQSTMSLRGRRLPPEPQDTGTTATLVPQEDLGAQLLGLFCNILLQEESSGNLKRFARTVTNKWLLFLLMTRREDVVVPALSLIGRLLATQPQSYASKFGESSKGFAVLSKALRRWSGSDKVWIVCISILFGADVLRLEIDHPLDGERLSASLLKQRKTTVAFPAMLPTLMSLLELSLQKINPPEVASGLESEAATTRSKTLKQVVRFFALANSSLDGFGAFASSSTFTRDCMKALGSLMTPSDELDAANDLNDVPDVFKIDEPRTPHDNLDSILSGTGRGKHPQSENRPINPRDFARRRLSSYVVIRADGSDAGDTEPVAGRARAASRSSLLILDHAGTSILEDGTPSELVDLLVGIFSEQVLSQKDFTGLGLFLKAAPGPPKRRAILNSYLMAGVSSNLQAILGTKTELFREPKAILNVSRFATQAYEALIEGWYINGALPLIAFCSRMLMDLRHGSLRSDKSVLLCAPALHEMELVLRKTSIFQLYVGMRTQNTKQHLEELERIEGWHLSVLPASEHHDWFCGPLICCILQATLSKSRVDVQIAASLLKSIIFDDPEKLAPGEIYLDHDLTKLKYEFFSILLEQPSDLYAWCGDHEESLSHFVRAISANVLEPFLDNEVRNADATSRNRSLRRKERLEQRHLEDVSSTHTWTEFNMAARHWTDNIYTSEVRKLLRARQDQLESSEYLHSQIESSTATLTRLGMNNTQPRCEEFSLDNIEGRDRMRLRLAPLSKEIDHAGYEPKRTKTHRKSTAQRASIQTRGDTPANRDRIHSSPSSTSDGARLLRPSQSQQFSPAGSTGEDFEVVASPAPEEEDEDKNRKVMRSLERNEQVKNVYNVSKIVGLEAHESLLIIGNNSLYIIDGLFQRSDGEVVSVSQAPADERDRYTQIIAGREVDSNVLLGAESGSKSHWTWSDILSISKRQFLTRPVALEFFFADGRSFLMTALNGEQRNALHLEIIARVNEAKPKVQLDASDAEWRMDLLKDREESSSRFTQVIAPMLSNPVTRRWVKGELSNFHYLMYVNTMAGRTFNDLTQYPVFPWVISDYTSEELDLSSPWTYRDLTKPMGCQTMARAEAFKERYASFAEMDDQTPAFHYGTHYSTAMIVTSYLIRLQPFVHSHVLLQGGSFDFADRLFFSVEKAWQSASSDTLSDVRELIPEFFYLPDFLKNVNGYDFGTREGSGEVVNDVALPPWAKGDPNIFIAKNREALESPFVSQNLHSWIDLVFGFKQRGEAAMEAVNVFHHLSYPGAKDLDSIKDQHERAATIGIIHNFGQTPRQIFSRPHDRRDALSTRDAKAKRSIQSLGILTNPVLERRQSIAELRFNRKLHAAGPQSVLVPPTYNAIMDWNFTDRSVRFTSMDSGKALGTFEQMHLEPISAVHFPDRKTLVTASTDCTISVWAVRSSAERIELQPRASLFEHQEPVTILASSKAFGTLLSASTDGTAYLWDLNKLEFIRKISCPHAVESARISDMTGHVLLCCNERVLIYTLNGHLLIDQRVCHEGDSLSSCAFLNQVNDSWMGAELVFTGHKHGFVNAWELVISPSGQWELERINQLRNDRRFTAGANQRAPWITCILPHDGKVFVGDFDGRAYEWNTTK